MEERIADHPGGQLTLLLLVKVVTRPDVDQDLEVLLALGLLDQLCRVVLLALLDTAVQVTSKGFLSPRALSRVRDRSKGRS